MTAQGRKLQVIDFFKQCCLNATRGRERVVVHPRSEACRGSFGRTITPTLSYDATRLRCFFTSGHLPRPCPSQAINEGRRCISCSITRPAARPSRRRSRSRQDRREAPHGDRLGPNGASSTESGGNGTSCASSGMGRCLLLIPRQRRNCRHPPTADWGQSTKSLRSSPLRGSKSREARNRSREDSNSAAAEKLVT